MPNIILGSYNIFMRNGPRTVYSGGINMAKNILQAFGRSAVRGNTCLIRYSFFLIKATQQLLLEIFDTHKYRTLLPDLYLIDDYIVVDIMDVYVNKYINEYIYLYITMLLCTRLLLFSSI